MRGSDLRALSVTVMPGAPDAGSSEAYFLLRFALGILGRMYGDCAGKLRGSATWSLGSLIGRLSRADKNCRAKEISAIVNSSILSVGNCLVKGRVARIKRRIARWWGETDDAAGSVCYAELA